MAKGRLNDLRWAVEVRAGAFGGFETMAAFNVKDVAWGYAADCQATNPHSEYRVIERCNRGCWHTLPHGQNDRFYEAFRRSAFVRAGEAA